MRSSSSRPDVSLSQKLHEAVTFLRWRLSDKAGHEVFDRLFEDIEGFGSKFESLTGRSFAEANVLEIGFGARPLRLIALMSMGINIRGIDLDRPMLQLSLGQLAKIFNTNGPERALKTAVRALLFDGRDRQRMSAALEYRGYRMNIDPARFLVGDAATYDFGSDQLDLIYSEDVFEHIPKSSLEKIVTTLSRILSPQGLAIITPNIFTGIAGGHLPDWYAHRVEKDQERMSEPWEHLRKKRYAANTYLNGLCRADYRGLFAPHFEIVEEKELLPGLGRRWLTPEVKAELSQWNEDELFSNNVRFILRTKSTS